MHHRTRQSIESAIVVGGGLAGISAALALARQRVHVTLIEAKRRLGGRAGSFTIRDSHDHELETIDYCQHVGMGCCANLKTLIDWLEQRQDWQEHRQLHFFGPSGHYQKLTAWPLLPPPLHLSGWLLKWPNLSWRDRWSIARGLLAIRRVALNADTEQQFALAWLEANAQTPTALEHFWTTLVVSALGEELSRVSLAAMAKVLQDGFLNQRDAFHLLIPTRPLGELFGSRAQVQLSSLGVEIVLERPVTSVTAGAGKRLRVDLGDRVLEADAVIVTVPWHQLSKIDFGDRFEGFVEISDRAQQLVSSPITGVHTWWDRPWLDVPHAAIIGRLCQWVFPKLESENSVAAVRSAHSATTHYYQIVISASRRLRGTDPHSLAAQIHADLAQVFPAVRAARLLRCKPVTDPHAVFSVSPESYRLRADPRVSERMALAGDWTRTGWPATMEGAILSGFRAAQGLLAV